MQALAALAQAGIRLPEEWSAGSVLGGIVAGFVVVGIAVWAVLVILRR